MAAEGDSGKPVFRSSTTAPVNIAVIKYWGKRDATLNLPTNSSLSITLSQNDLRAYTTAACSETFQNDSLMLNNTPQDIAGNKRTQACLRELRQLRSALEVQNPHLPLLSRMSLKIVSVNNFPTAAGLASSAAGFAALVRAIADLYGLPQNAAELSKIARQGSGSACRSLFGGYSAWEAGRLNNGQDSAAYEVAPASHWPTMRALIVVISDAQKDVGSTIGMQNTTATSALFPTRATDVVPHRMSQMHAAVQERDFSTFGLLCMRDSNTFHACCADTYPPIFYMTDASRAAIKMVEAINAAAGELVCAYTFDAGPNAVVFFEEEHTGLVLGAFKAVCGHVPGWEKAGSKVQNLGGDQNVKADERTMGLLKNGVKQVILTGVGEGPVKMQEHLVGLDRIVMQNPKR